MYLYQIDSDYYTGSWLIVIEPVYLKVEKFITIPFYAYWFKSVSHDDADLIIMPK